MVNEGTDAGEAAIDGKGAARAFRLIFLGSCAWWLLLGLVPFELLQHAVELGALGTIGVGCFRLAALRRGFALAGVATAVFGAVVVISWTLVISPLLFLIAFLAWQWLLLEGVRELPRRRRPGLAAQVRIVQLASAAVLLLGILGVWAVAGERGGPLVLSALGWAWWGLVIATLVTMHQVGRAVVVLLREPHRARAA